MSNKAEIKKIILSLGDKEIELNLDQAKKLYNLLNEIFQVKTVEIPKYPIIIERHRPYWDYPYVTWWDTTNTKIQMSYTAETGALNMNI